MSCSVATSTTILPEMKASFSDNTSGTVTYSQGSSTDPYVIGIAKTYDFTHNFTGLTETTINASLSFSTSDSRVGNVWYRWQVYINDSLVEDTGNVMSATYTRSIENNALSADFGGKCTKVRIICKMGINTGTNATFPWKCSYSYTVKGFGN